MAVDQVVGIQDKVVAHQINADLLNQAFLSFVLMAVVMVLFS